MGVGVGVVVGAGVVVEGVVVVALVVVVELVVVGSSVVLVLFGNTGCGKGCGGPLTSSPSPAQHRHNLKICQN